METASIVRQELFKYIENGIYPLGEYLDYENTFNFVKYMRNK